MFGIHRDKKDKEQKVKVKVEEPLIYFGEYIGGHSMYPKKRNVAVGIYNDFVWIEEIRLKIPFRSITKLGTEEAQRITKTRVFLTGPVIGLLWKKKFVYTVIDYNDGISDQCVIIDFGKVAEKIQPIIYERMLAVRTTASQTEIQP